MKSQNNHQPAAKNCDTPVPNAGEGSRLSSPEPQVALEKGKEVFRDLSKETKKRGLSILTITQDIAWRGISDKWTLYRIGQFGDTTKWLSRAILVRP